MASSSIGTMPLADNVDVDKNDNLSSTRSYDADASTDAGTEIHNTITLSSSSSSPPQSPSVKKKSLFQTAVGKMSPSSTSSSRGRSRRSAAAEMATNSSHHSNRSGGSRSSKSPGRYSRSKSPSVSGRMAKILTGSYHSLPALPINNDDRNGNDNENENDDDENKPTQEEEEEEKVVDGDNNDESITTPPTSPSRSSRSSRSPSSKKGIKTKMKRRSRSLTALIKRTFQRKKDKEGNKEEKDNKEEEESDQHHHHNDKYDDDKYDDHDDDGIIGQEGWQDIRTRTPSPPRKGGEEGEGEGGEPKTPTSKRKKKSSSGKALSKSEHGSSGEKKQQRKSRSSRSESPNPRGSRRSRSRSNSTRRRSSTRSTSRNPKKSRSRSRSTSRNPKSRSRSTSRNPKKTSTTKSRSRSRSKSVKKSSNKKKARSESPKIHIDDHDDGGGNENGERKPSSNSSSSKKEKDKKKSRSASPECLSSKRRSRNKLLSQSVHEGGTEKKKSRSRKSVRSESPGPMKNRSRSRSSSVKARRDKGGTETGGGERDQSPTSQKKRNSSDSSEGIKKPDDGIRVYAAEDYQENAPASPGRNSNKVKGKRASVSKKDKDSESSNNNTDTQSTPRFKHKKISTSWKPMNFTAAASSADNSGKRRSSQGSVTSDASPPAPTSTPPNAKKTISQGDGETREIPLKGEEYSEESESLQGEEEDSYVDLPLEKPRSINSHISATSKKRRSSRSLASEGTPENPQSLMSIDSSTMTPKHRNQGKKLTSSDVFTDKKVQSSPGQQKGILKQTGSQQIKILPLGSSFSSNGSTASPETGEPYVRSTPVSPGAGQKIKYVPRSMVQKEEVEPRRHNSAPSVTTHAKQRRDDVSPTGIQNQTFRQPSKAAMMSKNPFFDQGLAPPLTPSYSAGSTDSARDLDCPVQSRNSIRALPPAPKRQNSLDGETLRNNSEDGTRSSSEVDLDSSGTSYSLEDDSFHAPSNARHPDKEYMVPLKEDEALDPKLLRRPSLDDHLDILSSSDSMMQSTFNSSYGSLTLGGNESLSSEDTFRNRPSQLQTGLNANAPDKNGVFVYRYPEEKGGSILKQKDSFNAKDDNDSKRYSMVSLAPPAPVNVKKYVGHIQGVDNPYYKRTSSGSGDD